VETNDDINGSSRDLKKPTIIEKHQVQHITRYWNIKQKNLNLNFWERKMRSSSLPESSS